MKGLSRTVKSIKTATIVVNLRVYFIVQDITSSSMRRYTLYRARLGGDKEATIIGRELTLTDARKVIRRDAA